MLLRLEGNKTENLHPPKPNIDEFFFCFFYLSVAKNDLVELNLFGSKPEIINYLFLYFFYNPFN